MSLNAHIATVDDQPWIYIDAPGHAAGQRLVIFDAPLNLASKASIKLEIDFLHERTGMPRPDLYDTFRQYQNQQRRAA